MRIIIVDDEPLAVDLIRTRIERIKGHEVVGQYTDPLVALKEAGSTKVDVIVSDVAMPQMNGMIFAEKMLDRVPEVSFIFATAHNQYAVDAFRLNAIHYILKPVSQVDLEEALNRVKPVLMNHPLLVAGESCSIHCIGDFYSTGKGGDRVHWKSAKAEELFAILLLHQEQGAGKWKLIEWLWPESDPKKGEQNLYTTVFRLKTTLEKNGLDVAVKNINGVYTIVIGEVWCDYNIYSDALKLVKGGQPHSAVKSMLEDIPQLASETLLADKDYLWSVTLSRHFEIEKKKLRK